MREKQRLINGRLMTCPRCKKKHDILEYTRLMEIEEFQGETTPIYKAPCCKWLFAPADNLIFEILSERMKLVPTESES
jgi:hypothetical protein